MFEIRRTAVVNTDGTLEIKDLKLKARSEVEIIVRQFLPELPTGSLPVLPKGTELKLYIKRIFHSPVVARIRLEAPLFMRRIKQQALSCESVKVTVFIRADEVGTPEEEAQRLRVPQVVIHPDKREIEVAANSLNQALTLTSLKLEPERKSIGGRVYDYCAFEDRSLEELRVTVDLTARRITRLLEQRSALRKGSTQFTNEQSPAQLKELFADPELQLFYEPPRVIGILSPDVSLNSQWKHSEFLTFDPQIAETEPNIQLLTYTDPLFQKAVDKAETAPRTL